jgi:hypothetical protein
MTTQTKKGEKMKKERRTEEFHCMVPGYGPKEILSFHTQQGLVAKTKRNRQESALTWGLGLDSRDLLRFWTALSTAGPEGIRLLLARYGFHKNGPQSIAQLARSRRCGEETIRRKLKQIEGEIKRQLLRR